MFSRAKFVDRLESGHSLGVFEGDALGIVGLVVPAGEKDRHKGMLVGMFVRLPRRGFSAKWRVFAYLPYSINLPRLRPFNALAV